MKPVEGNSTKISFDDGETENITFYSGNPLKDIEKDIINLMKNYGNLAREMKEYEQKVDMDNKKMLLRFIEVADAFDNLFSRIEPKLDLTDKKTKRWVSNFKSVYKMLFRAFKDCNVVPVEIIIGEKASPYWHNVVEVTKEPDRENDVILEVLKKGYVRNGKLLRAAEVKAVWNG